jgi:hypothetical protein
MGTDVIGRKPTSEAGAYFGLNVWSWRPLAEYCLKMAPDIAGRCTHWQSNDGDGLTEKYSAALCNYSFEVENVQEFVTFLRACGGFEIH